MIRLNIVVEGQTEMGFVTNVLTPHLVAFGVLATARSVETGKDRRHGRVYHGGGRTFEHWRKDLRNWRAQEAGNDVRFATMVDLYRLPADFPGRDSVAAISNPRLKVARLEEALQLHIDDRRFIAYIQLHEFEALLLSDPDRFGDVLLESERGIAALKTSIDAFDDPELINEGEETAPSKRIIKCLPEYGDRKAAVGPQVAEKIGLHAIRTKCRHFDDWVTRLEALA
jgi:hypothetical protein